MRILLFDNHINGPLNFRKDLIESLRLKTYEVVVSVPYCKEVQKLNDLGFTYWQIDYSRHSQNPLAEIFTIFKFINAIVNVKPDIVLSYSIKPNIYGGVACRLTKIPQIINITGMGDAVENSSSTFIIIKALYRIALKKVSHVFFQNNTNMTFCVKEFRAPLRKSSLLPGSGVNLLIHRLENYPIARKNIQFLFIGRIQRDKGVSEYINAARIIHSRYKDVTFDIVGFFEDKSFKALIEDFQKSKAGEYLGISDNIHNVIGHYHAVVLPSYHEGMANVLLEAAACGRPVLASNIPGCRETFDEGISGFGFEPRSVDSLVQSIERFIALPHEQKAAMGLAGRKKMEREFDRQIVVDAYMREIENILEENNKKDKKK